jgi:hypothetical protein
MALTGWCLAAAIGLVYTAGIPVPSHFPLMTTKRFD